MFFETDSVLLHSRRQSAAESPTFHEERGAASPDTAVSTPLICGASSSTPRTGATQDFLAEGLGTHCNCKVHSFIHSWIFMYDCLRSHVHQYLSIDIDRCPCRDGPASTCLQLMIWSRTPRSKWENPNMCFIDISSLSRHRVLRQPLVHCSFSVLAPQLPPLTLLTLQTPPPPSDGAR